MRQLFVVLGSCLFFSCSSDPSDTEIYEPVPLQINIPENFPEITYNFEANPITEAGFELGKKLFYEGKLSVNNAVSCGVCHEQAFAFTHHGHTFSQGVSEDSGTRNSLPIQNLAFQSSFMWDGISGNLDFQPIIPITSEIEMGETLANIITKLSAEEYYQNQFARAFEDGEVSAENLLKALSQFMLMMTSTNSKYDKHVRNEEGGEMTAIETDGMGIFQNKCATCHATDLFTDESFRNTGLPINPRIGDKGRYNVLELEEDSYKFKVPSLRNVEVTGPYMHDGRFSTLEAVLEFYNSGVTENNSNVDEILIQEDGTYGIPLTDYEKESLIAFLKTLTDNEYLNDERFSEF